MKSNRPNRVSINGVRNIMSVKGKDPEYEYRFVNDTDDRIQDFQDRGYEIVKDKNVTVGDKRVANPTADGTPVQKSVGGGTQAYLMRIKKEWYDEDQLTKKKRVDDIEASMKADAAKQGLVGKLEITRS